MLALYAQLWRLGGVSDADGFAALAAVAAAIEGVVSATAAVRRQQ